MAEDDKSFQEGSVNEELSRGRPSDLPVDPASDEAAATAAADAETKKKKAEGDGKCELNCFFSALMVSGAIIAAVVVGLFLTKKLKET